MTIQSRKFRKRETWLKWRKQSIGASEAAAAIGESPFCSPVELWATKTEGLGSPFVEQNEFMEWGNRLEQPILTACAERFDRKIKPNGREVFWDAQARHLTSTPDAFCQPPHGFNGLGVFQVKNAGYWAGKAWADGPPLYHQIQVLQEMYTTGCHWGSLAVLVGGNRLLGPFDLQRNDPVWCEVVRPKLDEFYRCWQDGEMPQIDGSESCAQTLKSLYPHEEENEIELPQHAQTLLRNWERAAEQKAYWEKREKATKNQIVAMMGTATIGWIPGGGSFTYREQTRAAYTKTFDEVSYRVLRKRAPKR